MFNDKRNFLLFVLWGFFITNAMIAEVIGVKVIDLGTDFIPDFFLMSVGILPWPIVFLTTDIINEFYGKAVVRRLSLITACLIAYAFLIIYCAISIPADDKIGVRDESFNEIFGQSGWIILGSIVAFLSSQLIDAFVFWMVREKTGGKMIWLRATGSTAVSQLIDTFVVLYIGFVIPGKMSFGVYLNAALTGYSVKLLIAVMLTPLIYVGHKMVKSYLGDKLSDEIKNETAKETLHHNN
jgi:uncharacterized integral membrane protein (TIGR00697 family)